MERNSAVLHVAMTFEQRHKGNEEASSTDISGGKAFEANKIAEGRTMLGMCEQLQGDSEAGWVGEREQDAGERRGVKGRPGTRTITLWYGV